MVLVSSFLVELLLGSDFNPSAKEKGSNRSWVKSTNGSFELVVSYTTSDDWKVVRNTETVL